MSGGGVVFPLLLDLHVVPDRATHDRAGDCMMPSDVSADAPDGSAAEASRRKAGGGSEQPDENDWLETEHRELQEVKHRVGKLQTHAAGSVVELLPALSTGTSVALIPGEPRHLAARSIGSNMFEKSVVVGMACAMVAAAGVQAAPDLPAQAPTRAGAQPARQAVRHPLPKLDLSGRKRIGKASFYAGKFSGRKMADGTRMDPRDDNAASKTLPLGTTAKVTNLETGRSAVVTIRDRGPYVAGRIVDLSPATAEKVGINRNEGVSKVEVTPIAIPQIDEGAKARDALPDAKPAMPRPGSTSTSTSAPR